MISDERYIAPIRAEIARAITEVIAVGQWSAVPTARENAGLDPISANHANDRIEVLLVDGSRLVVRITKEEW